MSAEERLLGLQHYLAFGAIAWLALAFFLLNQAANLQKWVLRNQKDAPKSDSGLLISVAVGMIIILLWELRWQMFTGSIAKGKEDELLANLIKHALIAPRDFALGFVIASSVPAFMALVKFGLVGFLAKGLNEEDRPHGSPMAALLGAIFSLLQVTASIATLVLFFQQR
jgi:hypothetical protein